MITKRLQITLLSVLFICLSTVAQSKEQTVETLMEKTGSTAMFKDMDKMIDTQINGSKSKFGEKEDFDKFSNIMKSGFSGKKLEEYFVQYFSKYTNEDTLKSVIKMYEQPLMQEISKIEKAAGSPENQQEMISFISGLSSNPPAAERSELIKRLDNAMGGSEMFVHVLENMIMSMAAGANQALPADKRQDPAELNKLMKNAFTEAIKEQFKSQLISVWLYTYKDVDNEKLNKYIQIWESAEGKYYLKSSVVALDYTFSKMGEEIGKAIADSAK